METLGEKVGRYRKMNETIGDPGAPTAKDSDDLFYEITRGHDPAALPLLLLMRPYVDECEYADEMQQIVEEMETYPADTFYDEFMKVAGELCRSSPVLLLAILQQVARWEHHADCFFARIGRADSADRACLAAFVGRLGDEDLPAENRRRIFKACTGVGP